MRASAEVAVPASPITVISVRPPTGRCRLSGRCQGPSRNTAICLRFCIGWSGCGWPISAHPPACRLSQPIVSTPKRPADRPVRTVAPPRRDEGNRASVETARVSGLLGRSSSLAERAGDTGPFGHRRPAPSEGSPGRCPHIVSKSKVACSANVVLPPRPRHTMCDMSTTCRYQFASMAD